MDLQWWNCKYRSNRKHSTVWLQVLTNLTTAWTTQCVKALTHPQWVLLVSFWAGASGFSGLFWVWEVVCGHVTEGRRSPDDTRCVCGALPGDSCTPEFRLSARPGSLTVHLSGNHSLAVEHADHAKHRVYYGKEGEPLEVRNPVHVCCRWSETRSQLQLFSVIYTIFIWSSSVYCFYLFLVFIINLSAWVTLWRKGLYK